MNTILALLMLAAPAAQATRPPVVGILATLVEERDAGIRAARLKDPKNVVSGLLVDVGSFSSAVDKATGLVVGRSAAEAALQGKARSATFDQAHRCGPWPHDPKLRTCWIVNNASFVRVDAIARTASGYDVWVTSYISGRPFPFARSPGRPPLLESVQKRISFIVTDGRWVITGEEQTATT